MSLPSMLQYHQPGKGALRITPVLQPCRVRNRTWPASFPQGAPRYDLTAVVVACRPADCSPTQGARTVRRGPWVQLRFGGCGCFAGWWKRRSDARCGDCVYVAIACLSLRENPIPQSCWLTGLDSPSRTEIGAGIPEKQLSNSSKLDYCSMHRDSATDFAMAI
nr:hypothetical protein CFP56_07600 [Quercus suber]